MKKKTARLFVVMLFAAALLLRGNRMTADEVRQAVTPSRTLLFALLFDDRVVANNVTAVRQRASKLADTARYEYLVSWVLPSESHSAIRMNGIFTQTDPAPVNQSGDEHVDSRGGVLVSPVFDLLDLATKTRRLPELLEKVNAIPEPRGEEQRRARAAMLVMIHMEMGQQEEAGKKADLLLRLVTQSLPENIDDMWPETLVVHRGVMQPGGNATVEHLLEYLYTQRSQRETPHGLLAWHNQIASLAGRTGHLETVKPDRAATHAVDLEQWVPVSRRRSSTRGLGLPQARWEQQQDRVDKISGHDEDYLFFRSPLTGHYEVHCDISHAASQAMVAGTVAGSAGSHSQIWLGTFRDGAKQQPIDVRFSGFQPWVRYRCVVRDNVATTWLNGLPVRTEEFTSPDPWVAVRSWSRSHGSAQDVQITGHPVVPNSIDLSGSSDLRGWYAYHDETVDAKGARWEHKEEAESTGQIFGQANAPRDSWFESLLTYQRPLEEVASVDYQFFYEAGVAETHPALDRMAFVLKPDGIRIHWITDSKWDAGEVRPDNLIAEPGSHRGPAELPLKPDAWNQMTVAVDGSTVALTLNSTLIYEDTLDLNNHRTFGLFHFADQSEVRVRNVSMSGNWPRSLPSAAEQELADRLTVQLDADLPKLKAVFSHDFAADGFPGKYFTNTANVNGTFAVRPDGVFVAVPGEGQWRETNIRLPFTLHGDFDMEVSFDQLRILSDHDACIMMDMELDDPAKQLMRIMRIRTAATLEQMHASFSLMHNDGGRSWAGSGQDACEAMKGRLRLARRGNLLHYLFAENDSDVFHAVATETCSDAPSKSDTLLLHTHCHGVGDADVLWKSVTLRAERLTLKPGPDNRPPVNLYAMNPDGSNLRMLAAPMKGFTQISSVEWSADGTKLVSAMSDGSAEESRVIIMNSDGSGLQDLGPGSMPSPSPDNSAIVFSQPTVGIIRMHADGSGRKLLNARGWGPQWSRDGGHIAWALGNNVTLMDVKTNKRRKLMTNAQSALFGYVYGNLSWSPDGKSIAFKARSRDRTNTFMVVSDTDTAAGFRMLYSGPDQIMEDVTWHPDGRRVVFAVVDQTSGLSKLIMVNRDSAAIPEQLTGPPADWTILGSDWSPDGMQIVFSAHLPSQPVDWPPTGG